MGEAIMVGMAEVKVTRSRENVLIALGLGSCIGVCAFDPVSKVFGMAHVVLPDSGGNDTAPCKFADKAIPHIIEMMKESGASPGSIKVAIAGGASLFAFNGNGPRMDIGPRNSVAVKSALDKLAIRLSAVDVGGSAGRTVYFDGEGRIRVKTLGQGERELVCFGQATASSTGTVSAPIESNPGFVSSASLQDARQQVS